MRPSGRGIVSLGWASSPVRAGTARYAGLKRRTLPERPIETPPIPMRRASVNKPCAAAGAAQPTASATSPSPTTDVRTVLPGKGAGDKVNKVRHSRHARREPGHAISGRRPPETGSRRSFPAPACSSARWLPPALDQPLRDGEAQTPAARGGGERRLRDPRPRPCPDAPPRVPPPPP